MSKKFIVSDRQWLNPEQHNDTGMFAWGVEYEPSDGNCKYDYVEAHFDVWDCSRKTSLNFGFSNEKQARQRAEKLDMLIKALHQMREHMATAYNKIREDKSTWEESESEESSLFPEE